MMLDFRRQIAADPDDPELKLDNRLKQIKLFALDTTYVLLVWVLLFVGVSFSIAPIYLANEQDRPALIRGLQVNARLFILAILVIVGGKLVQETLLAFLVRGTRGEFSPEQREALRRAANRLIEKQKEDISGINRVGPRS